MSVPPDIEAVALLGWKVFPSSRHSRAGAFKGAHLAATDDLDQIERWCGNLDRPNWRVLFGPSKLWGLDVDAPSASHASDGIAAMRQLVAEHGPLPPRPTTRSGGGGYAVFFAHHDEPIIGKTGHPAPGIDPRRGMLSVTIPPSVHVDTGKPYVWLVEPWKVTAPAAPPWLLHLVAPPPAPEAHKPKSLPKGDRARNYAVGALYNAVRRVASAGEGARNNTLNSEAFALSRFVHEGALSEEELRDALYHAAVVAGLLARDSLATIQSALRAGRRA